MDKLTEQPIKKKIRNFITLNSVTKDEIRQEYNEIFDKLQEYENKQEWISVEDMLPPKHELVLCIGAKGGMFLGEIKNFYSFDKSAYTYVPNSRGGRYAKYWMPLPTPPKMKGAE